MWSKNSTSKNWPKSKLAEVEIGRSRNWPKSKLAEVELAEVEKKSWPKSKLAEVDRARKGRQGQLTKPGEGNSKLSQKFFVFLFFMLIVKAKLGIGARPNLKILRLLVACTMEEEISDTCLKRRTKFLESGSHFPSFGRAHLQSGRFANHTFHVIHTEEALVF